VAIDSGTIIVAGELVRLHGIHAPELDQTFWWRGQQMVCGTMTMAALEALIAGLKVRCDVVEPNGHFVAKGSGLAGWSGFASLMCRSTE
jgi:endonuclease YncB( thermonuclease family)